jgi:polyisoprenoid-binding protein YceI
MSLSTMPAAASTSISRWEIDPAHSHVEFAVKHLMIATVKGRFADLQGVVQLDGANPGAATLDATIKVASIDTREKQRDAHLRSVDFLDAARFPTIGFRSRRVLGDPLGSAFRLVGALTLRGITREVVLDVAGHGRVRDMQGNERAGFSARTTINRKDFGLTWNQVLEGGGVLVGDEVRISVEVELVRQAAQTAA